MARAHRHRRPLSVAPTATNARAWLVLSSMAPLVVVLLALQADLEVKSAAAVERYRQPTSGRALQVRRALFQRGRWVNAAKPFGRGRDVYRH
jgi:hypothetical protein